MTDLEMAEIRIQHLESELRLAQETLRDKFAMAALTGLESNCLIKATRETYAAMSYSVADAMLEARKPK